SLYLEGFGALFLLKVNFPLVEPPAPMAGEDQAGGDWELVKKELSGLRQDRQGPLRTASSVDIAEYNPEQVNVLKHVLIDTLKNASHIRALKPGESIAITVLGSEGLGASAGTAAAPRGDANSSSDNAGNNSPGAPISNRNDLGSS